MKRILPILFFFLASLFLLYFFFPKPAFSVLTTYCNFRNICITCDGSSCTGAGCSSTWVADDLTPCQQQLGSYQSTCCTSSGGCTAIGDGSSLNLWDYNYGSGCIAEPAFFGSCTLKYTYRTQTCGATDSCLGTPYLSAGQCSPGGCSVGGVYKTCCNSDGTVDGSCQGGQFTGTCPGGSATVICGVSQSTCDAVYPYRCSTASCGGSACLDEFPPPPTEPPPPTPSPCVPGSYDTPCTTIACGGDFCNQAVYQCRADGSGYDFKYNQCTWDYSCGTCGAGGGGGGGPWCGDGTCDPGEDCGNCSADCGSCSGGNGIADFEVNLYARNQTKGTGYSQSPIDADPEDILNYLLTVKNWSSRQICWFNVYDNFFDASGAPYSKWQAIMDGVGITCYDSSICWVDWRYDPDFTAPGPAPNSPNMLAPWDSSGRGLNYTGIDVCGVGEMDYAETWVAYFDVQVKDNASLGSICSFGEKAYVYYDGDVGDYGYNACISSGGTTNTPPGDFWVRCNWWFGSNDVVVNLCAEPPQPPPQCTAGGPTDQANRLLGEYYNETLTGGNFENVNYAGVQRLDPGGSGWLANAFQVDWNVNQPAPGVGTNSGACAPGDPGCDYDNFKVRWTGWFNASLGTGNYYFFTEIDDGERLWVGTSPGTPGQVLSQTYSWGSPIISDWNPGGWDDCGPNSRVSGPVSLQGGQWYPIKIEYYEGVYAAAARLRYGRTANCGDSTRVPYTSFRSCTATQPTLGTIGGTVYQNTDGVCTGSTAAPAGWSVTCSPDGTAANISGSNYQCQDASGNTNLPYGAYVLDLTAPAGWQVITGAGCGPDPQSVTLNSPSATPLPFYIWQGAGAWFQTQEGDVHTQGDIISRIPSTASNTNFSWAQTNYYPGVVSFGGSQANFGSQGGTVSTEGWLANSYFYPSKADYSYFYQKLGSPTTDNFSCESAPCPDPPSGATTLPSGALLYYSANNISINQNNWQIPANTKVIVLVNGDLNISLSPINGRITVPQGSFLAFIVKGNINIDGNIGNKQADITPFLQGVYLADGVIDTYQPDPVGLGSGFRFIGAGVFYAKGGVRLDRDVKEDPSEAIQNSTTPSELFTFRPDLIINAPAEILSSKLSWVEIVP